MQRVMLFVDGSNLVGTLNKMRLRVDDYEAFYRLVFERAIAKRRCYVGMPPTSAMTRVLWYVIGTVDEWDFNDAKTESVLREVFDKDRDLRRYFTAIANAGNVVANPGQESDFESVSREAWGICYAEAREWYRKRVELVGGFRRFYRHLRFTTDFIDVIECGHWKLDLLAKKAEEKGVDTRLAVDMVTLYDSYDLAVLLSGDADTIPSLDYVKQRGKHVAVVELLQGGATIARSPQSSSRLKSAADFVVQIADAELLHNGWAQKV